MFKRNLNRQWPLKDEDYTQDGFESDETLSMDGDDDLDDIHESIESIESRLSRLEELISPCKSLSTPSLSKSLDPMSSQTKMDTTVSFKTLDTKPTIGLGKPDTLKCSLFSTNTGL